MSDPDPAIQSYREKIKQYNTYRIWGWHQGLDPQVDMPDFCGIIEAKNGIYARAEAERRYRGYWKFSIEFLGRCGMTFAKEFLEGYVSYLNCEDFSKCPYRESAFEFKDWRDGWNEAKRQHKIKKAIEEEGMVLHE